MEHHGLEGRTKTRWYLAANHFDTSEVCSALGTTLLNQLSVANRKIEE
ncbi:hypothetical protein POX_f08202 [Penicillium oxalicum]|nr:hypothetical protein POX_f08202 [Penicillium oxalicum]KAI2787824.1 hypothetical protein POX_f08202 [Penicillium oxalicum]